MSGQTPFFVFVPGASQNPAHYGYLCHLLMEAGYPVFTGLLSSVGETGPISARDDADYVRERLLIPVLDHEERDVIIVMHSYSSIPGSAAVHGLSKEERKANGKDTGVIGQIFISSLLVKGDKPVTVISAFGGQYPPHIRPDPPAHLLRCDDRAGPLYNDVTPEMLQDASAVAAMAQGIMSFTSPCPRATWDAAYFEGRIAFIRTLKDNAIPLPFQQMMLDDSAVDWIVEDIDSGHSPQLSQPKQLQGILLGLAKRFQEV